MTKSIDRGSRVSFEIPSEPHTILNSYHAAGPRVGEVIRQGRYELHEGYTWVVLTSEGEEIYVTEGTWGLCPELPDPPARPLESMPSLF